MSGCMQTTCPYCGVGCGVTLLPQGDGYTVQGRVDHPANRGRLCVKGSALAETLAHPQRLLSPMQQGQPIPWDLALDRISDTLQRLLREQGPDSIAFYLSGQLLTEDYYVANKLAKGFLGTANVDTNSRLCMSSAVAAHKRAFGEDLVPGCYEDLELADLVVLTGSNTAWAHPVVYQRIAAARQARPQMRVVVIDPRRTATCDLADLHLPLKPGSDALLFNALLVELWRAGACDQGFLACHCQGWEEALAAAQADAPSLQQVAEQTELEPALLRRFFDLFIQTERVVTLFSMGINQSSSGVDKGNTIINCHLATGRIGKPGATPFSMTGQPNAMGGREVGGLANQLAAHMDFDRPDSVERVARFWQAPAMATRPGLKAVELFEAIEAGRVKFLWVMGSNPLVSLPDAARWRRAVERLELLVVSDCIAQTDTLAQAHLQLPALGWGEKDGTVTNSERCISRQRAFLPPSGQARADWWALSQVAQRLGFAQAFAYQSAWEIFREHAALSAFENEGQRFFDLSAVADLSREQYDQWQPRPWPINARHPQGCRRLFRDGRFATADGRARLLAVRARRPAQEPAAGALWLNTGRLRDQWHTMTRTGAVTRLGSHQPEPFVELNPEDARQRGIEEGALVRVFNERGTLLLKAQLQEGQRRGSLFVPMHWSDQFASQARMGDLVAPVVDPLSGQPESKHSHAWVEPVSCDGWARVIAPADWRPAGVDYWSLRWLEQGLAAFEIAGSGDPATQFTALLAQLPPSEQVVISEDPAAGWWRELRWCGDQLLSLVLLARDRQQLPERDALYALLSSGVAEPRQRRALLAGRQADAAPSGRIICSCFQVGERAIDAAIANGCDSVAALGEALRCGTNCGSCIPELKVQLSQTRVRNADSA